MLTLIYPHYVRGRHKMSFYIHFSLYTANSMYANVTYTHPEQCVGQVDGTPGCHHTHQQRHRDHGAPKGLNHPSSAAVSITASARCSSRSSPRSRAFATAFKLSVFHCRDRRNVRGCFHRCSLWWGISVTAARQTLPVDLLLRRWIYRQWRPNSASLPPPSAQMQGLQITRFTNRSKI